MAKAKTYYHVMYLQDSGWFHQFSADTRGDADCEVEGLRRDGYRVKVIRSAKDPMNELATLNSRFRAWQTA